MIRKLPVLRSPAKGKIGVTMSCGMATIGAISINIIRMSDGTTRKVLVK